jgi:hypothetical protein
MTSKIVVGCLAALVGSGVALAQADVEREVAQTIRDSVNYTNTHKADNPAEYSKEGALEFWSSGGLMHEITPGGEGRPGNFDSVNLAAVHIRVLPLPGGKAAVAMYYLEGSLQPAGSTPVPHYMTRVTQVFAKEDGKWKIRSTHWSSLQGGSGTSQTAPTKE